VAQNAPRPAGGSGPDRAAGVKRQQQDPLDTRPEPDFQAFARCRVSSWLRLSLPFVAAELPCLWVPGECGLRRLREAIPGPDRDGKQRVDASGNRQFAPMLEWRNRELGSRSASVVIALIERARSNVLGGSDG
jgi:hypothetical protein